MDIEMLEYLKNLNGLQLIGAFVLIAAFTLVTAKYKSIILFFKKKKIELEEVKIYKIKANLVLKTMKRCKNLIMSVVPNGENNPNIPAFTKRQIWIWHIVLTNAFMGPCRTYCTDLATSRDWVKMKPAQFAEICENEPKWIIDSVTQECIDILSREPEALPVSFEVLSLHNRDKVGAQCVKYIIEHFEELRRLEV